MHAISRQVSSVKHARRTPPSRDSLLSQQFAGADLLDAYAIQLPPNTTRDIGVLAEAVLGDPAPWFSALLRIRDAAAGVLNLKTTRQVRASAAAQGTPHINFFPVISSSDREIILGEDDTHLEFRASLLLRDAQNGSADLVLTTVVQCHNTLGRAYLAIVRPFHQTVVRSSLDRAQRNGWPGPDAKAS
jgi:hypothetical protein